MQCSKIICLDKKPKETYKLFFGDTGKMLRVDIVDYPVLMNTFKKGFSDVWAWTVVDFKADIIGWQRVPDTGQRIFLLNNGYQTVMDSGVVGIYNYLAMLATNSELKLGYQYIAQNESIHAGSYSYGLSQMFGSQAEEKIDIVYTDQMVQSRMDEEIDFTDELFDYVIREGNDNQEAKALIFKAIFAAYALEHIKFPFSFYSTWNINRITDNAIQGFSMLLKLIAQDELDFHVPMNKNVLKILMREKRQGFQEVIQPEFMYEYVNDVVKKEKKWSEYLLADGELPGFTHGINNHFIEYFADKTLTDIGLDPIFGVEKTDTINWFNEYRKINNMNSALQEISNVSYNKGVVKNDIKSHLNDLKKLV